LQVCTNFAGFSNKLQLCVFTITVTFGKSAIREKDGGKFLCLQEYDENGH